MYSFHMMYAIDIGKRPSPGLLLRWLAQLVLYCTIEAQNIHADRYTTVIALRTLQAVGDQFGTLMETVVSISVAILISFVVNWLLTLVIVVFVPIMVGAGLLQLLVLALHATHYKKSTEEALKV